MANLSSIVTPGGVLTAVNSVTVQNKTIDNTNTVTAALTNPTVTNYTETLHNPSAAAGFTVNLSNGTIQRFTTNGNTTITLPASVSGKSFMVIVLYGGAHSITWAGGSTIKWQAGVAPTPTSVSSKFDIFTFFQDGTNTYGSLFGQNF